MLSFVGGSRPPRGAAESASGVPEISCVSIQAVTELADDAATGRRHVESWLTAAEIITYDHLTVPKRRRDWLAGRIAAKQVIRGRELLDADPWQAIEIHTAVSPIDHGRPYYRIGAKPGRFGLSICHCGDSALAALAVGENEEIGIDVERVEPRDAIEPVALSRSEQLHLSRLRGEARDRALTLIWVLKEALLKALGIGLRMPLGQLSVNLQSLEAELGDPSSKADLVPAMWDTRAPYFSIDPSASHLHPQLSDLEHLPMRVATFSLGDAVGCWITLPRWEETWKR